MSKKIIKVAALPIENRRILLARSQSQTVFFTVGGKIEDGESELECLKLEVFEEIGCQIKNPVYFQTFVGTAHNKDVDVELICYFVDLQGDPSPQSEIAEITWWNSQSTVKLSDMLKLYVLPSLKDRLE